MMSIPNAIRMKPEPASVLKLSEEYPLSRAISSSLAATRMRVNRLPTEVTVGPQCDIRIMNPALKIYSRDILSAEPDKVARSEGTAYHSAETYTSHSS